MLEMEYPEFKVRIVPKTPNFGAVVEGVDAKLPLAPELVELIKNALWTYKVLFLPQQHLEPAQQQRLADYFGEPFEDAVVEQLDPVTAKSLVKLDVVPYFHTDMMHLEEPPTIGMLHMNAAPPVGGDSLWADLVASYEDLSEPIRDFIDPLVAVYETERLYWNDDQWNNSFVNFDHESGGKMSPERLAEVRAASLPHDHPIVITVPETGKKNYWVSRQFTRSIVGLNESESTAILNLLYAHQLQPRYVIRWRWEVGDLALWDFRTTLHSGVADYGDAERHGYQAKVKIRRGF